MPPARTWEPPLPAHSFKLGTIGETWSALLDVTFMLRQQQQAAAPNQPVNILVFGNKGAGKSSFVNMLFTIFSRSLRPLSDVATACPLPLHVTQQSLAYRIECLNMNIIDFWGVSNRDVEVFGQILDGSLPLGAVREEVSAPPTAPDRPPAPVPPPNPDLPFAYQAPQPGEAIADADMWNMFEIPESPPSPSEKKDEEKGPEMKQPHYRIHAAIMMLFPQEGVGSMLAEQFDTLKDLRWKCHLQGIPVLVGVNKCDDESCCPEIAKDPEQLYASDAVARTLSQLDSKVQLKQVFPLKLYHREFRRNKFFEVATLRLLYEALHQGAKRL